MYPEHITYPAGLPVRALACGVVHIPYHWHDALEIIYVFTGELEVNLSDETHRLRPAMVAVANAHELHRMRHVGSEQNRVLLVQIERSWCEQILPDFPFTFFWCCSTYGDASATDQKYRQLRHHLHDLARALVQPEGRDRTPMVHTLVHQLLTYLSSGFDFIKQGLSPDEPREKQAARIKQMYEYVVERKYQVSLSELAQEFNLSPYHISHVLSERYGLTFQEMLSYSKGEEAAKLLLGTDMRITDVSQECGFSDPKYLVKYFREHYGCTPTQFRRYHRVDRQAVVSAVRYNTYPLEECTAWFAN